MPTWIITCQKYFITSQNILSHAKYFITCQIFYHMPDHYESFLVIMPPFSIHSLYNAETAIEYKREAKFCTLVRFPPLRISPTFTFHLPRLACIYSHCNPRLLSSYYLSFALNIVNLWLEQLLMLCYTTCRTVLTTSTITSDR